MEPIENMGHEKYLRKVTLSSRKAFICLGGPSKDVSCKFELRLGALVFAFDIAFSDPVSQV